MFKNRTLKVVENRNQQFEQIAKLKEDFSAQGLAILSIDTKKKELLGNFYREGKLYTSEAQQVNDHDFKSFSTGEIVPHVGGSNSCLHHVVKEQFKKLADKIQM